MSLQRDLAWRHLDLTYRSSVAHQVARYALAMNYSSLPANVVHQAKRCVLDALGCAIGAYEAPGREVCETTVKEIGGTPESTVFCSGLRTSALNAALVNSFLVRYLDFNDIGGGRHNSDALSSLLAIAERTKSSGQNFLTSLVVSYELGARFQDAVAVNASGEVPVHSTLEDKGWTNDIRGGLTQPPALGKLMGLTEEQIANAIGICMSHSLPLGIIDANREENMMVKNIRFGWVAHDAILSCMLARNGFTGPVRVVESEVGIRKVLARDEMDLERLLDFSGWRMLNVRFKDMPLNATTSSHVAATIAIVKEQDLKPADIAAVRIRCSVRESKHTTTPAKKYPRNAESADHSAFYANALAIKERSFHGPEAFKPEKFTDPVVLDLIEKITVEADPSFGRYQGMSEIRTTDGQIFQKRVDQPHGLGNDPLSDQELEEKFKAMASRHMGRDQTARLIDACWNVDKLADMGDLAKLMVFPKAG